MIAGMHGTLARFNSITSFATTVLFALLGLVALVAYPFGYAPPPSAVTVRDLRMFRARPSAGHYAHRPIQDVGAVTFDLDADLRGLFNWNTKQVFLTLSALYDAPPRKNKGRVARPKGQASPKALLPDAAVRRSNEVVLWDRIVQDRDDAYLHLDKVRAKYALREVSRSFQYVSILYLSRTSASSSIHTSASTHTSTSVGLQKRQRRSEGS